MKYENVKFNVGNEEFDVVHCLGDGQCECDTCKKNGKWSLSWTSWFYKLDENDKGVLCRDCLMEILIQRRIDKAINDKIENGTLIKLPCRVGDTVYVLVRMVTNGYPDPVYVFEIHEEYFELVHLDIFGKTIFLTREEAEKRLKELQE